jgi:acyl-lipid omega-6 desaturase (Delta-12 desaturase)
VKKGSLRRQFDWHLYYETTYYRPLLFVTATILLYFGSFSLLLLTQSIWLKLLFSLVYSLAAGKLFVVGHDACHNSFTPSFVLNRAIGTLSLTLSFHVYSLWEHGHNRVHHTFTNLRAKDFVWRPLSFEEYAALSPVRRALQRVYRTPSGIGFAPYYLVEILLARMVVPRAKHVPIGKRLVFDLILFYSIWIALLSVLVLGEYLSEGHFSLAGTAINLLFGIALPLAYVSWAIGFVVFFNHTHPSIPWFGSVRTWSYWEAQQRCTLHLRFSRLTEFLLPSKVMNHVVHHLDTRVPVRKLRSAQDAFNRRYPHEVVNEVWSPTLQAKILTRCKLYDYSRNQWLDFDGNATSPPLEARISPLRDPVSS